MLRRQVRAKFQNFLPLGHIVTRRPRGLTPQCNKPVGSKCVTRIKSLFLYFLASANLSQAFLQNSCWTQLLTIIPACSGDTRAQRFSPLPSDAKKRFYRYFCVNIVYSLTLSLSGFEDECHTLNVDGNLLGTPGL